MLRILTLCGLLALSAPAVAADHTLAMPTGSTAYPTIEPVAMRPMLKPAITVTDDLVRIGDLVEHAGAKADIAIFRSPDPGSTGAVATRSVLDALYPYGLADIDTHGVSEVSVTRSSRDLTAKDIETDIRNAIAGEYGLGDADALSLTLDQTLRTIHLEPSATGKLQVVQLAYDPHLHQFDIVFDMAGSAILKRTPLHLSGTVTETSEIVTLARSVQRGDVVRRSDLVAERRPRSQIGRDSLADTGEAVGLAARRQLRAGEALHHADLMRPELVQRNGGVTLVYEVPGIVLTVRGKALESGAAGDVVSVLNLQSKRTVQGTVTGPGRVHVASIGTQVASIEPARRQPRAALPHSAK